LRSVKNVLAADSDGTTFCQSRAVRARCARHFCFALAGWVRWTPETGPENKVELNPYLLGGDHGQKAEAA
jgi:hypothetical protein